MENITNKGDWLFATFAIRCSMEVLRAANDEGLWDKVAAALGVSVGELKEKWIEN